MLLSTKIILIFHKQKIDLFLENVEWSSVQ